VIEQPYPSVPDRLSHGAKEMNPATNQGSLSRPLIVLGLAGLLGISPSLIRIEIFEDVQIFRLKGETRPAVVFTTELTPLRRKILRLLEIPQSAYDGRANRGSGNSERFNPRCAESR
jgi:hypothetical protein